MDVLTGAAQRRALYADRVRQAALAGRRQEVRRVRETLDGEATARVLLVLGEPGIGKSRVIHESSQLAGAGDAVMVVSGDCLPLTEKLPLLPIVAALRAARQHDCGQWFQTALTACPEYVPDALTAVLPELGQSGDRPVPLAAGDPWLRQRLFAAIGSILAALSEVRRVALVVEDVHWADTSTLDLLDYLIGTEGDVGVPVVLTARDDDPDTAAPNADWLTRAETRPGVDVLVLTALSVDDTAEQVALLLGTPPDPEVVAALFARSEGNPLFTEQLVGNAERPASGLLPRSLRAVFDAKLAKLGTPAQTVARTLAAFGAPLPAASIGAVTGLDDDSVLGGLRELQTQRLLRPDTGQGHALRHALLGDAVSGGMLAVERADLHRRVAQFLADTAGRAGEIAEHWQLAGDAGQELRWRVKAAEQASNACAPAQAAAHWLRVLDLWGQVDAAEEIVERPYGLACCCAADQLGRAGLPQQQSRVLEDALADASADDYAPGVRAELLYRAAWSRGARDAAYGLRTCVEAVALFERTGPAQRLVLAQEHHVLMLLEQGQSSAARPVIARALDVSATLPGRPWHRVLLAYQASCAIAAGDGTAAAALLDTAWAPEFDCGPREDLIAALARTDILLRLGRFADIAPVTDRALLPLARLELFESVGNGRSAGQHRPGVDCPGPAARRAPLPRTGRRSGHRRGFERQLAVRRTGHARWRPGRRVPPLRFAG